MAYKRNSPGIFEPFELTRRSRGCLYDRSITHLFEQSFLLVHSPRAGRDQGRALPGQTSSISIHSPRAGRDSPRSRDRRRQPNFNPLAPCGARREREYKAALGELFQSTRPVRGETCAALAPSGSSRHFNPLAPCGARPPAIWIYDCSEANSASAFAATSSTSFCRFEKSMRMPSAVCSIAHNVLLARIADSSAIYYAIVP